MKFETLKIYVLLHRRSSFLSAQGTLTDTARLFHLHIPVSLLYCLLSISSPLAYQRMETPCFSFGMNLPVGSPGLVFISSSFSSEKCILPPFLLSTKGNVFLASLLSFNFSLLIGMPSFIAVCTGPEEAIEIILVFHVGAGSQRHPFM
ncbi:hypothetical protein DY000_02039846 [Brassica cretica]|uniref:Uncharacterized protein n=1 Tax=Brassica cretica TaxID=69181 RepID=A0ABQ7BFC4_BRACR|nr:hypothetical protein DY000_02039846 [Brassica cretica]